MLRSLSKISNATTIQLDPMASLEVAQRSIRENGFWTVEDADIGMRVDSLVKQGFQFKTEEGIELCKAAALGEPRVRGIIESFFDRSVLGFYKSYGQTKHDHCVINRTPELRILVVFAWSSRSEMMLHYGSHLHALSAGMARNGLLKPLEPSDDFFRLPGINSIPKQMEHGGLAIGDARAWFKVLKGKIILLGIMIPDEVQHWHPMPLPASLRGKVQEMASETIMMNFDFGGPEQ